MDTVEATVQRILGTRTLRVCSKGYLAEKVSRGGAPPQAAWCAEPAAAMSMRLTPLTSALIEAVTMLPSMPTP